MVEFIGFIISLLALFYLFIKQNSRTERQTQPTDDSIEGKEEYPFKQFLREIKKEVEARENVQRLPPPPSPPKVAKQSKKPRPVLEEGRLKNQIEQHRMKTSVEDRRVKSRVHQEEQPGRMVMLPTRHPHIEENRIKGPSRVQLALHRLASRKDLIIYQEIIDKPKSMRP